MVHVRGVDQRAPARLPAAFPANIHSGVIRGVAAADDHTVGFQPEYGAVAQLDAADEIFSGGHNHFTAAANGAGVESLLKGNGVLVGTVSKRAEIADIENRS